MSKVLNQREYTSHLVVFFHRQSDPSTKGNKEPNKPGGGEGEGDRNRGDIDIDKER